MGQGSSLRMTLSTQLVLRALLTDAAREVYGLEISGLVDLPSGTTQPILARLESAGWLESRWEGGDPRDLGRPRRRYYRLSTTGLTLERRELERTGNGSRSVLRMLRPDLDLREIQ